MAEVIRAAGGGGGLSNVVEDTTPQLGGDLDANGADVTGVGHIGFLATQDASAGANDLDDYEEGTWTPAIADNDSDGSGEGQTYTTQIGRYVKVGRTVFITGTLILSSLGTLTTTHAARVVGLPFTAANISGQNFTLTVVGFAGLALPAAQDSLEGAIPANTAYFNIRIWESGLGTNSLLLSEVSADGNISFSGFYEV